MKRMHTMKLHSSELRRLLHGDDDTRQEMWNRIAVQLMPTLRELLVVRPDGTVELMPEAANLIVGENVE